MSILTLETSTKFETVPCCACGIVFAMPELFVTTKRDQGGDFYCPNGHTLGFATPRCTKLENELAAKQAELTKARCEALAATQKREQVEAELKRHQTRTKNGVCPCCNRTFVNLQRHMATKHPAPK